MKGAWIDSLQDLSFMVDAELLSFGYENQTALHMEQSLWKQWSFKKKFKKSGKIKKRKCNGHLKIMVKIKRQLKLIFLLFQIIKDTNMKQQKWKKG